MIDLTSLDGSFDKTLAKVASISELPGIIQKFMMVGVSGNKLTFTNLFDEKSIVDNGGLTNVVAQLATLDDKQQTAFIGLTKLDNKVKETIIDLLQATKQGELFNSKLFEQNAAENNISKGVINEVMQASGMKDSDGNYLLTNTKDVCDLLEQYANDANNAEKAQQLFNAGLLEQSDNGYKVSASLLKLIGAKKSDIATTGIATAAQLAWNAAVQIGKQLLLSLGVAAVAFIATKIVDYIMNLKTRSEELVDTMNDSHNKAEQATKDVEEIQSKIDDLNSSLKEAGAEKIEDIADPAERERLQAINDMLQAQLELKKQLEKDTADKANADTSAVVNDKTEDSIVKIRTVNVSYAEDGANAGTHQVAEKVSKTESLEEHTAALNELIDKRRELATAGKEDTQEYKDNEAAITSETEKIEELSSAVSEQMDGYETDADSFAQYKDEYVAGTNAMTAATKALADAQDSTGIDTTNLDIFSEKVKQIKNDIDNGDSQQSDWKMFQGLDAFSGMTGEAVLNIDNDSAHQTEAESTALEKLHAVADENKISFEGLIGVFETFGLLQVSNSSAADNYAEQLEATMGVIDNIQSAYKNCSTAVEEYNKYGYLSVDSLQSLLQMDDEYLNTLELVNGKLQINQESYANLLAAQYAEAQMEAISQAISELNAIAKGDAAEKAETFTEATEDEKNKLTALCPALKDATVGTGELASALAAAQEAADGGDADAIQAKIDGVMNALNTRLKLIGNNMSAAMNGAAGLRNQLDGFSNSSNKAADSSNKAADSSKTLLDAWSTLTSAMKEYNEQGYITFQTLKSLTDLEDKYSSMLVKNDTTGKLEMKTQAFYDLMKAELKEAQAKGDGASEAQYNKILEWTDRNIKTQTMDYWDLVAAIEGYSAALSQAKEITDGFKDAWSNGKTIKEKIEKSRAGALDYEGTEAQSSALQDLMKYSEYDPELISKAFNKETGKIDLGGDMLKTAVAESLKQQAEAARTEGGEAAEAIAASYEKSAENIENDVISVQDYFDGLGSTIEEVSSKIDELQSAWSDLGDVTNEYNTYGGLSVDSIQKLLTTSPEYLQFLKMDGDQLVFNRDAMLAYAKANLLTKAAELELKDETKDQAEILRALANSLDKGADSMDGMGSSAEKLKSIFSDMKDLFSSFLDLIESANSKKDNDLKLWGEAMTEDIDKRIDALNKQKEALQDANDEEERAITLAKLKAELEKARTQRTVRKLTSNGYEWVADESAVKEAQDNLNDQQREWNQEDAEKAIDDQIDKLNELKDKYSEIISLIGTDWDDYNKKLKYASEIADMTFTEMEGRVDVFKGNVLASMQAANPISSIKTVISNIESLISTLEKVGDVWDKLEGGNGGGGLTGLWNKIANLFGKSGTDGNIQNIFQKGYNSLKNITSNFFGKSDGSGITGLFKNGLNTLVDGAKSLFNANNVNSLTTIFSNGLSEIGSLFSNTFKGFGKVFSSASGGTGIFSGIGKFFKGIGTALGIGGGAVALSSVPTMTAANTAGMTGLAGVMAKGAISAGAVGTGGALAGGAALGGLSSIPVIGAIVAGATIGVGNAVNSFKRQKEIWSSNDSTGTKIVKSVGKILWDISPIGILVNSVKTIGGWVKKIFGIQDKKSQNSADPTSANGKVNVGDIVINSPDKPASATKKAQQQTDTRSPWKRFWDNFWGSKFWFWNWGKKASGSKNIEESAPYNVDEQGPELIVRKPESGRYTYLETGDGVVPADITSKLFEMGGNPDKWFNDQLSKHTALSNIQNHTVEGDISVGDIYIQNPVGDTDVLAKEIIRDLPIKLRQERGRR